MKDLYVSEPPYGGFTASRSESARALACNIAESDKESIEPELAAWDLKPERWMHVLCRECGQPHSA